MDTKQAKELLRKYQKGTATPEEQLLVKQWFNIDLESNQYLPTAERMEQANQRIKSQLLSHLNVQERPTRTIHFWPRIAAAASILLILSAGGYFLLHKKQPNQQIAQNQPINIKPGSKKAILTLAGGQKISLTDANTGTIAKQGNATVTKTKDGQVVYQKEDQAATPAEVIYNTITTPRAGYYPLKMADGTIAILDAQSSIKYPVTFGKGERVVEITGQVYFEVKHDAAHPFKVMVRGQAIEDMGTSFNINAYEDEPVIRTTLVEGSIAVSKNGQTALVKPGQQAITKADNNSITIKDADIDEAIAWKNGQTSFTHEDIEEIMRQVSRWYDVDVEFKGNLPKTPYVGGISRNANLADLLKILEFNDVHFTVENRKIIVKP